MSGRRVCLGVFIGAHGVRGAAKVKAFTEKAEDVAAYGPVVTENGARQFTLSVLREAKPGVVIVTAPEIESREDAAGLNQTKIYVPRDRLPQTRDADEHYLEDLVGMTARSQAGAPVGRVSAVHNFGAGDLLELRDVPHVKGAHLIPFTREAVPEVDVESGAVTISEPYAPRPDDGDDSSGAD